MGLRYRKSINLGLGFRINLSKTGVGYSWGIPGARITKTATGRNRTTVSIPGTGISYVTESGGKRKHPSASPLSATHTRQHLQTSAEISLIPDETMENADVNAFAPAEYQDFLNSINRFNVLNKATSLYLLFIGLTMFSMYFYPPIGVLMLSVTIVCICVRIIAYKKYKIDAHYELDEYGKKRVELINMIFDTVQKIEGIWQVNEFYQNSSKDRSGAAESVIRTPVHIQEKNPQFLRTNVPCYSIKLKYETLYVLPDKILIEKNMRVGVLEYKDIKTAPSATAFIEETPPTDAEIIGETWRYVNKNGSPDKRYKDNYKCYECKYGVLEFTSEQGFNTVFHFSSVEKLEEFMSKFLTFINKTSKGV